MLLLPIGEFFHHAKESLLYKKQKAEWKLKDNMHLKIKRMILYSSNAILWILYGIFYKEYSVCFLIPLLLAGYWLILDLALPNEEKLGK